jgi:hypothetical protein
MKSFNTLTDFYEKRTIGYNLEPPPNHQKIYISENNVRDDIDLANGKYIWQVEVPSRYLPGNLSLEVTVPMANFSAIEILNIWVDDNNSEIDLGVIDFNVIRLWGNLPVTFNGESPNNLENVMLNIRRTENFGRIGLLNIGNNENWIQDTYARVSETPLIFTLETHQRGGYFNKILNKNHIITIHDMDKEIIFPDYPYVNFEAYTLKGTINLHVPSDNIIWNHNSYLRFTMGFYDNKKDDGFISYFDVGTLWTNENVVLNWETMLPFFPLPKTLLFELVYLNYNASPIISSVTITDETDLQNIFLGSF